MTTAEALRQESSKPLEILVVDDNVDAADLLHRLLTMLGYSVHRAYGGCEALALAREHKPDVALLDLRMPGMDGIALARQLAAMPELQPLSLIAVSADADEVSRQRTRNAGFCYHLAKPASIMQLTLLLDSLHRH